MLNNDSLRQRAGRKCDNMCFTQESDEYAVSVPSGPSTT